MIQGVGEKCLWERGGAQWCESLERVWACLGAEVSRLLDWEGAPGRLLKTDADSMACWNECLPLYAGYGANGQFAVRVVLTLQYCAVLTGACMIW